MATNYPPCSCGASEENQRTHKKSCLWFGSENDFFGNESKFASDRQLIDQQYQREQAVARGERTVA